MLNSINMQEIKSISESVLNLSVSKNILIHGYTFKAKTDDLRSSPSLEIFKLLRSSASVYLYDFYINDSDLIGENKYIYDSLSLSMHTVNSPSDAFKLGVDLVILTHSTCHELLTLESDIAKNITVFDLVGSKETRKLSHLFNYHGLYW